MKKILLSGVIACSLLVGSHPIDANAATVNVQGGVWNYGIGITYVYSNYDHSSKTHGSTAIGTFKADSGSTRPGNTAKASAPVNIMGGNKTYYRIIE